MMSGISRRPKPRSPCPDGGKVNIQAIDLDVGFAEFQSCDFLRGGGSLGAAPSNQFSSVTFSAGLLSERCRRQSGRTVVARAGCQGQYHNRCQCQSQYFFALQHETNLLFVLFCCHPCGEDVLTIIYYNQTLSKFQALFFYLPHFTKIIFKTVKNFIIFTTF